jgi:hypothetical protein
VGRYLASLNCHPGGTVKDCVVDGNKIGRGRMKRRPRKPPWFRCALLGLSEENPVLGFLKVGKGK